MTDRRGGTGGLRGDLKQRVKTGRGRTLSQKRWLERQLNDPYVARAKREGYRSRAAFKLIEIDERFKLVKPGQRIVDLGAAPGGWSQVAAKIVGESGRIVGIDLLDVEPMAGATFIGAKDFGPESRYVSSGSKKWTRLSVTFKTGQGTTARIYCWRDVPGNGACDDMALYRR